MTKLDSRFRCRGNLDNIRVDNKTLTIEGWVASQGAGRTTGLDATVSGKPCRRIDQALQLPSPDVRTVFPALDESDRCRFMLRVTLPEGMPSPIRDVVVAVEPSFVQGRGQSIWNLAAPSLPDPPQAFVKLIGEGFREAALEFRDYFVNRCNLNCTDNVLEVGCGVGRMAYGLVSYLQSSARYEGFDIVPDLIIWAQQEISSRYPNFQFRQAPIYNSFYNPTGHLNPTEFIFPYQDAGFEFVFLTSVFTHMSGDAVQHYMHEIRRVLKTGGRCLVTCFLLNGESISLIRSGKSGRDLSHPYAGGMVAIPRNPDAAIGFDEDSFKGWLESSGLEVIDTLYGNWCGRAEYVSYQDILILQG